MSGLVRVGDLTSQRRGRVKSKRHVIDAAENLAIKIMFPNVSKDYSELYVHTQPSIEPEFSGLPDDIKVLSEYEAKLLGKLRSADVPIVCIEGAIGSGKTTTINYLIDHVIMRSDCSGCKAFCSGAIHQRLFARIDLRRFVSIVEPEQQTIAKLMETLCDEMCARAGSVIDQKKEVCGFWRYIVQRYDDHSDLGVSAVARVLLAEAAWLRSLIHNDSDESVEKRQNLLTRLRQKDLEWYLRYLVVFWRYLLREYYACRRDCVMVILDNVDTLPPRLQRILLDFVMRTSHIEGPTFVILLRPETRMRHGLSDDLMDVVPHDGPEPWDVVIDRLNCFLENHKSYFTKDLGLTEEQANLITGFLQNVKDKLLKDEILHRFIQNAAGKSVRTAQILAQHLLMVDVSEMRNPDITSHFLVRACVTHGQDQFVSHPKSAITNPFDISGVNEGRLLVKVRILRFMSNHNGMCSLNVLRSAFAYFGYSDDTVFKNAINDLLRNECQLLRSDGYDVYREIWGDEQETLYLTAIGQGYASHLLYDTDFVQEVMLDSRIDSTEWPIEAATDLLTEKMTLLYRFLRDIYYSDVEEVRACIERHGAQRYKRLFGNRLPSLDLIRKISLSVDNILRISGDRYPKYRASYSSVQTNFSSLMILVEESNRDLIGVLDED